MSMYKLHYFNGRGRGERVRFALGLAGVDYQEEFIRTRKDMLDLMPKLRYGQLPMLETPERDRLLLDVAMRFKTGQSFEEAASTEGVKCTTKPTIADSCAPRVVEEAIEVLGEDKVLGQQPKLAAWRKTMLQVPNIAKFLKSSHRMPSTVDDASAKQYHKEVAAGLGW
ncbi:Glutathione S-transferase A4 [Perkinsus olseni]|uniref:Glutathione S-transferase A4 n=1 Tax=Perkinsus olseni TaxID=32597 RepID=A0A7J6PCC5_PEROL|nr:Glutathione S-transferase A4 [Perkinsus olseni]